MSEQLMITGMNKWDLWKGRRCRSNYGKGEIFIETDDVHWQERLSAWRQEILNSPNGKTECPCPLPKGHIAFETASSDGYFKLID